MCQEMKICCQNQPFYPSARLCKFLNIHLSFDVSFDTMPDTVHSEWWNLMVKDRGLFSHKFLSMLMHCRCHNMIFFDILKNPALLCRLYLSRKHSVYYFYVNTCISILALSLGMLANGIMV